MATNRPSPELNFDIKSASPIMREIFKNQADLFKVWVEKILKDKFASASNITDKSQKFEDILDAFKKVAKGQMDASSRSESLVVKKNIKLMEKQVLLASQSGEFTEEQSKYLMNISDEIREANKHSLKRENSLLKIAGRSAKERIAEKIPSLTGMLASIGLGNPLFMMAGGILEDIVKARKDLKEKQKAEQQALLQTTRENEAIARMTEQGLLSNTRQSESEQEPEQERQDTTEPDSIRSNQDAAFQDLINAMVILTESTTGSSEAYKESIEVYKSALDRMLVATNANEEVRESVRNAVDTLASSDTLDPAEFARMSNDIIGMIAVNKTHLPSIDDNIDMLVKDTESSKFQEIEREREQKLEHEQLINALEALGQRGLTPESAPSPGGKEGMFSSIMHGLMGLASIFDIFSKWKAAGGIKGIATAFVTKFGTILKGIGTFAKVLGRLAAPIAIVMTALDFAWGAFKGWGSAAEKLGKTAEEITTSDKIASAIGGGLGALGGIADSILGFFGFETEIGKWVDENTTKIYAFIFDTFKNLAKTIKDFFVEGPTKLIEWFEGLFSFAIPEIEWSMTDFLTDVFNNTIDLLKQIFDFDFEKIYDDLVNKMKQKLNLGGFNFFSETPITPTAEVKSVTDKKKEAKAQKKAEEERKKLEEDAKVKEATKGEKAWDAVTRPPLQQKEPEPVIQMTVPESGTVEYPEQDQVVITNPKLMPKRKGVFKEEPLYEEGVYPQPLSFEQPLARKENTTTMLVQDSIQREKNNQRQSAAIINAPKTTNVTNNSSSSANISAGVNPRETDATLRMMQYGASF